MSVTRNCGQCRWWDSKHPEQKFATGLCRVEPPSRRLVGEWPPPSDPTLLWPTTGKHAWCGAFEQR